MARALLFLLKRGRGAVMEYITAFRAWAGLVCLLLIMPGGAAVAQGDGQGSADLLYQSEIEEAERLGALISEHDTAAWVATDFLFESVDANALKNLRGWVEERIEPDIIRIHFYRKKDIGEFAPFYSLDVIDGQVSAFTFKAHSEEDTFNAYQAALVRARELALGQQFTACSGNYNTVILPYGDGKFLVYLLAATTDPNEIVLGGHYRFTISGDGRRALDGRKFTNSCIVLRTDNIPEGAELIGPVFTHLLDPHPNELHVFLSLLHGFPLFVITTENRLLWEVSEGSIELTDAIDP